MTSSSFIATNWYWIVAAAASGGMLLWQQIQEGGAGGGLTPTQAVQLINKQKAVIIDVCEPAEFAAAHVTGAKNIPLGHLAEGKGLPSNKATPLVVVCAAGTRSARAVAQLQKMGYENAQSLSGGLKAWREAHLPTEKA